MTRFFGSRKFRFGTLSVALTMGVIAIVVALNIILSLLGQRFNLILDLTQNKEYKLSKETVEYLKTVEQDVEVVVLNNEIDFKEADRYFNQAALLLDQFSQANPKIKIKYVDLDREPAYAKTYADLDLEENGILIIGPNNNKALTLDDLFTYNYTQYYQVYISESNVEQAVASGIYAVTSELPIVTILKGHDEMSTSSLEELLKKNNFEVKSVNIATEEIDKNTSVVVIPAPKRDYTAGELEKLDAYFKDRGREQHGLVTIFGYEQEELPNLEAFIKEWGIEVSPKLAYETNAQKKLETLNVYLEDKGYILIRTDFAYLPEYAEEVFAKDLARRNRQCVMLFSRVLNTIYDSEPGPYGQKTTKVLTTTADARLYPKDEAGVQTGQFTSAAKSVRESVYDNKKYTNTAFVLGSKEFFGDELLWNTGFANYEFALNVFNELSQRKSPITIQPKTISVEQMPPTLTAAHIKVIGLYVFTILLPLCVLGAGLFVWMRRRHL